MKKIFFALIFCMLILKLGLYFRHNLNLSDDLLIAFAIFMVFLFILVIFLQILFIIRVRKNAQKDKEKNNKKKE